MARSLTSDFKSWYLDDGPLGSVIIDLLHDLEIVRRVGPTIGLFLNDDKCEIVTNDVSVVESLKVAMPNIRRVSCGAAGCAYW